MTLVSLLAAALAVLAVVSLVVTFLEDTATGRDLARVILRVAGRRTRYARGRS